MVLVLILNDKKVKACALDGVYALSLPPCQVRVTTDDSGLLFLSYSVLFQHLEDSDTPRAELS